VKSVAQAKNDAGRRVINSSGMSNRAILQVNSAQALGISEARLWLG